MSASVRRLAALALASSLLAAGAAAAGAQARPALRIDSLRVVQANGRAAAPPYRRAARHDYVVAFRLGRTRLARLTRAATLISPRGFVVAAVRPRATLADPGAYRARARLAIGADDAPGVYVLRYTVVARGEDGSVARARKVVRLRFR